MSSKCFHVRKMESFENCGSDYIPNSDVYDTFPTNNVLTADSYNERFDNFSNYGPDDFSNFGPDDMNSGYLDTDLGSQPDWGDLHPSFTNFYNESRPNVRNTGRDCSQVNTANFSNSDSYDTEVSHQPDWGDFHPSFSNYYNESSSEVSNSGYLSPRRTCEHGCSHESLRG